MDEVLVRKAEEIMRSMQILRNSGAGKLALILFDTFLCLDREIQYIWKSGWSFTKCTYLITRYGCVMLALFYAYATARVDPTPSFCWAAKVAVWSATCTVMPATTAILAARTWAMYQRKRYMLYLLIGLYHVTFVPAIVYTVITIRKSIHKDLDPTRTAALELLPNICPIDHLPPFTNSVLIAGLCYETILFFTMMWKVSELRRGTGGAIIGFLFQEAMFYYLVIAVALLSALVLSRLGPYANAIVASGYMLSLRCIMVSRMVLELKGFLATISMSPPITTTAMPNTDFNPPISGGFYSRPGVSSQVARDRINIAWRAESPGAHAIHGPLDDLVEEYEMTPQNIPYRSLPGHSPKVDTEMQRMPWMDSPETSNSILSSSEQIPQSGSNGSRMGRSKWPP